MTIDSIQIAGISMGSPVRLDGKYHYRVTVHLELMTLVNGRLEYIKDLPLIVAVRTGWNPSYSLDIVLDETANGGSPSIATVGQSVLTVCATALADVSAVWAGKDIVYGVPGIEPPPAPAPVLEEDPEVP